MLRAACRSCARIGFADAATLKRSKDEKFSQSTTATCPQSMPPAETATNSQLSTLKHQLSLRDDLCGQSPEKSSRNYGMRDRESSRPRWSLSRSERTEKWHRLPACVLQINGKMAVPRTHSPISIAANLSAQTFHARSPLSSSVTKWHAVARSSRQTLIIRKVNR